MERRHFLAAGGALSLALVSRTAMAQGAAPQPSAASAPAEPPAYAPGSFKPHPAGWRAFQVKSRLEIAEPKGVVKAWIPLPSLNEPDWMRPMGSVWSTNARNAYVRRESKYDTEMLYAEWGPDDPAPLVEVESRFATRDRAVDLAKPGADAKLTATERKFYTASTMLLPTDGIVRDTAARITAGAKTDMDKARRIYEWVVDSTARDPKTRGCGVGDIASMLKADNLRGKCADLNALFVGLCRASGVPARDVYGLRVAPSKFGFKSLGANSETVTKAQHCRSEVYLAGFGWVPADPADVRKVMLEEPPGNLPMTDAKVADARRTLFGAWEGNWMAYNVAHDLKLPGGKGPLLPFLMYPQAETAGNRLDSLDPAAFKYEIVAKEVTA
ncbi:MAG: transglutaminase-like domain-containing protein [Alphaproteobacteria bacterium]